MKYTYIILDDNPANVLETQAIVARFQTMQCIGTSDNYNDGLNLILEHQPNLIFLEVEPDNQENGLCLGIIDELHRYLKHVPKVIVTTKQKHLAYEAIKYETLDYLLKPLEINSLRKAILRFEKTFQDRATYSILDQVYGEVAVANAVINPEFTQKNPIETLPELPQVTNLPKNIVVIDNDLLETDTEQQEVDIQGGLLTDPVLEPAVVTRTVAVNIEKPLVLCVKSYGDYRYIDAKDIQYFQADNNSTDIYLQNGEMITAFKTLKLFEEILPAQFSRIHNSYIVNIDYVSRIHTGNTVCYIKNATTKLPFSKSYKQNVDAIIATIANGNYLEV